jgi:Domain of unknown function (DUF4365)
LVILARSVEERRLKKMVRERRQFSPTERQGVTEVERIVLKEMSWIFREQVVSDFGIDAQIEVVDHGRHPTGQLIAVQIKTGSSYFRIVGDTIPIYVDDDHLKYWDQHALPVILVLHDPDTMQTVWQWADLRSARKTERRWAIDVPKKKIFGAEACEEITEQTWSDDGFALRRRFAIDREFMRKFDGKNAYISIVFVIDQTPRFGFIDIFFDDPEKNNPADYRIEIDVSEGDGLPQIMSHYLPWLDYEHVTDPDPDPDQFETHELTVRLSEPAIAFLKLENYFEGLPYI